MTFFPLSEYKKDVSVILNIQSRSVIKHQEGLHVSREMKEKFNKRLGKITFFDREDNTCLLDISGNYWWDYYNLIPLTSASPDEIEMALFGLTF